MFSKLNYVYEVYKTKSFTKAAENLYISQPSLSAAIKKLEENLGAQLFERLGTGVELTEVGKEYICAVEKIIEIQDDFNKRLSDIHNLETGKISVGGTNYLSSYLLPKIIKRFKELYPKIEVTLVEANSITLSNMIKNDELDIIIDSFDETLKEYDGEPLASEKILLCVPREYEINKSFTSYQISPEDIFENWSISEERPSVSLKKFKNQRFITLKHGNDMAHRAAAFFEEAKISPEISFTVDQLNISYALSASGMGACFLTDTLFKYGKIFKGDVVLYNVDVKKPRRTLYVAYKKNKYVSYASAKFIELAKELIKENNA